MITFNKDKRQEIKKVKTLFETINTDTELQQTFNTLYERITNRKDKQGLEYANTYTMQNIIQGRKFKTLKRFYHNTNTIIITEFITNKIAPKNFLITYNKFVNCELKEADFYILKEKTNEQ